MATKITATANVVKQRDPELTKIGDPRDLNNISLTLVPPSMTLHLADLYDAVEEQNLGVAVADSHIIKCTTTGKIRISMLDDNRNRLEAVLVDIMYAPGLS
jgi:hypothetical protein